MWLCGAYCTHNVHTHTYTPTHIHSHTLPHIQSRVHKLQPGTHTDDTRHTHTHSSMPKQSFAGDHQYICGSHSQRKECAHEHASMSIQVCRPKRRLFVRSGIPENDMFYPSPDAMRWPCNRATCRSRAAVAQTACVCTCKHLPMPFPQPMARVQWGGWWWWVAFVAKLRTTRHGLGCVPRSSARGLGVGVMCGCECAMSGVIIRHDSLGFFFGGRWCFQCAGPNGSGTVHRW